MGFIPVGAGSGRLTSFTIISQPTTSYTPPAGTRALLVECIGPGGAGGGATTAASSAAGGSGGGGGAYARSFLTTVPASPITVAVGVGGTGVSGANGNPGSADTSFNAGQVLAKAGQGGIAMTAGTAAALSTPGVGGSGGTSVGDYKTAGPAGGSGLIFSGTVGMGGRGAGSNYGGGTGDQQSPGTGGSSPGAPGSGGAGGLVLNGSAQVAGGAGADGRIIVWEFA